jgi:putative ABC transport system permease protein
MGMTLVEGRNFSREFGADPGGALIVNEAFLHYFGWTSGLEKTLPGRRFPAHRIIGVVRDFNFQSLRSEVRPVALVLDPTLLLKGINDLSISSPPSQLNFVNIRVAGGDMAGTLDLLRRSWKETAPDEPFQFSFLDQDVERQYRDIARWGQVLGFASGFTILIACLGLFGLAALSVARRTREIGIRKVLGASPASIITMFAREFSGLVIAANLIAWPLAFLAMRKWLENFAYRSSLDVLKFPVAGLLALVVALVTVAVQSVKAALSDPAETTRYE